MVDSVPVMVRAGGLMLREVGECARESLRAGGRARVEL